MPHIPIGDQLGLIAKGLVRLALIFIVMFILKFVPMQSVFIVTLLEILMMP